MKKAVFFGVLAVLGTVIWACVAYEHGLAHFLGIDTQGSQNYDFVSGVGPMFITAVGYGGLITAVISKFNCHQDGCWRVGKHHIGGTPWCGLHHANARPELTVEELLTEILNALKADQGGRA